MRALALVVGVCALTLALSLDSHVDGLAGDGEAQARTPKPHRPPALAPAGATGAFGLDLMRALPPGNLVISPDSIAAALAMAGTGAKGRTAAEIAHALHLAKPAAFPAVGNLQRAIAKNQAFAGEGHPKAPTLELANGMFVQRDFPVRPSFTSGMGRHFGVSPEALDFKGDLEGSREAINAWVSDRTHQVIPELFSSLPVLTRLVLANAVYLNAEWLRPFTPSHTSNAPFYNRNGRTPAQFMHKTERLRYGTGRGYAAVELPYRASTLSLMVMLPRGKSGVSALQRQLDAGRLGKVARRLSPRPVELSLPRFHLNTHQSLNNILMALGMTTAFSELADFSRITGDTSLKIADVVHAADIRVDEQGTVAAAATGVVVVLKSRPSRPHAVKFNANHPFLFFLRDRRSGAILFAGRLVKPEPAGT